MSKQQRAVLIPTLACGLALTLAQPVLADKDKGAGGGKPDWKAQQYDGKTRTDEAREQYRLDKARDHDMRREEHRGDNEDRKNSRDYQERDSDERDDDRNANDRNERRSNMPESRQDRMDQLRDRKTNQEQKELGRGSEQGQESREEHSRKWWKFWDR